MASRDTYGSKSERVKVSDKSVKKESKKSSKSETVRLVLQRDLRLKYTGPVSKKSYVFSGAGAVLDVDKEDADIMIQKRGGICCEGSGVAEPQPYFAILEEG